MKNRRRAIDCKLIRESKDNPGYFRYDVTIKELSGEVHVVPAYGVDMEDAISRLVWNERIEKVVENKTYNRVIFIVWLLSFIVTSYLSFTFDNPVFVLCNIGFTCLIALFMFLFDIRFTKKMH
jgi:hypothetical protein